MNKLFLYLTLLIWASNCMGAAQDFDALASATRKCFSQWGNMSDRDIEVTPEFKSVVRLLPAESSRLTDAWATLKLNRRERSILIEAVEQLSSKEYLRIVEALVGRWERHEIDDDDMVAIIVGVGAKEGFFAWYYDKPTVRALLLRLKPLEARRLYSVSQVISGSGKEYIMNWNAEHSGTKSLFPTSEYQDYVEP